MICLPMTQITGGYPLLGGLYSDEMSLFKLVGSAFNGPKSFPIVAGLVCSADPNIRRTAERKSL